MGFSVTLQVRGRAFPLRAPNSLYPLLKTRLNLHKSEQEPGPCWPGVMTTQEASGMKGQTHSPNVPAKAGEEVVGHFG